MLREKETIYTIAERAEVSIATVSRVLRGSSAVSEKTRERVEKVIAEYHFKPSAYARSLSLRRTRTLGIILPKISNPNYALVFEGAYDEAAARGYVMTLFPWENMLSAGLDLVEVLTERRLDGVVICLEYVDEAARAEWHKRLKVLRQYMEVVLIGSVPTALKTMSVTTDLGALVRDTARYLIARGHERIAFIGGFDETGVPGSRDEGYREALREAKLPCSAAYRAPGLCTEEAGAQRMNDLLDALKPSQWPTAVIAANDLTALGVMRAVRERGLNVPRDICVIGCDNLMFAAYANPPLASVNTHQRETGRRAVKMLLDEAPRGNVVMDYEIVPRESVGTGE